jgi:hypothetical protein
MEVFDFVHLNQHLDLVVVRRRPEFARAPATNSTVIACYVTSWARLHLYESLQQVLTGGGKLLYCDT